MKFIGRERRAKGRVRLVMARASAGGVEGKPGARGSGEEAEGEEDTKWAETG